MCLMNAHPNVLSLRGLLRASISNRPVRPFLAHLSVCLDPPGRDRTRPCGTLCESGGWLHCVRQASRTSLVLVLRFNSQIRPALPFLFPFDLGCSRTYLASALSLPSLLLLTFPVYFQVSSHSFYQRSLLSLPPTPLPPLTPLPWSPSTHLSSLPTSPTSLSQPHFSCV